MATKTNCCPTLPATTNSTKWIRDDQGTPQAWTAALEQWVEIVVGVGSTPVAWWFPPSFTLVKYICTQRTGIYNLIWWLAFQLSLSCPSVTRNIWRWFILGVNYWIFGGWGLYKNSGERSTDCLVRPPWLVIIRHTSKHMTRDKKTPQQIYDLW